MNNNSYIGGLLNKEIRVPDVIQPGVCFKDLRYLTFSGFPFSGKRRLVSPIQTAVWHPKEVQRANCWVKSRHRDDIPGYDCTCGIYGYYSPIDHLGGKVKVCLQVWGGVVHHRYGLRAENARIVFMGPRFYSTWKRRKLIKEIAKDYEVPYVPLWRMRKEAKKYGALFETSVPRFDRFVRRFRRVVFLPYLLIVCPLFIFNGIFDFLPTEVLYGISCMSILWMLSIGYTW